MAKSDGPDWLGDGESIAFRTRESWLSFAAELLQSIVIVAVLGLAIYGLSQLGSLHGVRHWLTWIVVVGIVAAVVRLGWSILAWSRSELLLTNEKVVHVYGVLSRHIDATPLVKVDDVTVQQSIVGRVFRYGQLLVDDGSGDRAILHGLRWVPRPVEIYRMLTDAARRERAYEGGAQVGSPPPTP